VDWSRVRQNVPALLISDKPNQINGMRSDESIQMQGMLLTSEENRDSAQIRQMCYA